MSFLFHEAVASSIAIGIIFSMYLALFWMKLLLIIDFLHQPDYLTCANSVGLQLPAKNHVCCLLRLRWCKRIFYVLMFQFVFPVNPEFRIAINR